jgi:predicted ATPase with chaperone activity
MVPCTPDKDVKGQKSDERALESAAAGGYNLLMVEPIKRKHPAAAAG